MNQQEQAFSRWLCTKLQGMYQRVETAFGRGTPDIWGCRNGFSYWIETKIRIPGKGVLLRKEQYAWLTRAAHHGVNAYVVALDGEALSKEDTNDELWVWRVGLTPWIAPYGKYVKIHRPPDAITVKKAFEFSLLTSI